MNILKEQFLLNPNVHYLNFGFAGSCPKPVFDNYQYWQRLLEFESYQFLNVNSASFLAHARNELANYIGVVDKDDLVFITNPTLGTNIVAKNLILQEGDEILATDIEYGACDRTWDLYCTKSKAIYKRQKISLPILSKEAFINNFFAGVTNKTKAIFISEITSSTALILPVKEIVAKAKSMGLLTFVDGAHVPGQLPLNIQELDCDFYTGACHKWMMAPKGCSFLYAHKRVQHLLKEPLIVSWGYKAIKPSASLFLDYNQLIGTRDLSAFLALPACINFMKEHNWPTVSKKCNEMVLLNAERFYTLLDTKPICPLTSEFIGQMLSIPIHTTQPEKLQRTLFTQFNIEIPIFKQGEATYIRYSINGFNIQEDLDELYNALLDIKINSGLID